MCINTDKKSRACGVCVKLRGLLKIHYRLYHGTCAKERLIVLPNLPKKKYLKPVLKVSQYSQTEDCDIGLSIKSETFEPQLNLLISSADNQIIHEQSIDSVSEIPTNRKIKTIHVNIKPIGTTGVNRHACDVCHKTFRLRKTLRRHHARMHNTSDSENEEAYTLDSDVLEAITNVPIADEVELERKYKCTGCGKSYTEMKNFKRHCKMGHKDNDYFDLLNYDDSTDDFTIENLESNEQTPKRKKTKVEKQREFKCDFCPDIFAKPSALKRHLRKHTKEKSYLCEECGVSYSTPGTLRTHMKTHSGEGLYPCDVCNKIFATKTRLIVHARIHSGEKPFSCEYCGRGFSNISGLKPHLRLHTGEKPYKCRLCDYASTVKAGLKQHMVNHGELTVYSCHLCDKKFRFKAKYKAHLIMHTGERRHFCNICNRGFFYANEVKKHISTVHSQARPFKCPYCDQAYKRKTHVNRHMQSAHRIEYNAQKCHEQDNKIPAQQSENATLNPPVVVLGNLNPGTDLQTYRPTSSEPNVLILGDHSYQIPTEAKFENVEVQNQNRVDSVHVTVGIESGSRIEEASADVPQNLTQPRDNRAQYVVAAKPVAAHKLEDGVVAYEGQTEWYAAALASAMQYQQLGM